MSYELKGKLHKVFPTESKTDTFQAREFVVETQENYPQLIKFQLTQDKCSLIDSYNEGEEINVHFDLRGREWNEKYFTNLQAWKLDKVSADDSEAAEASSSDMPVDGFSIEEDDNDLPF